MIHFAHDYEAGIRDEQARIIELIGNELVRVKKLPFQEYQAKAVIHWMDSLENLIEQVKEEK